MENFVVRQVAGILEKEGVKVDVDQKPSFKLANLKNSDKAQALGAYSALGGARPGETGEIGTLTYPLVVDKKVLIGLGELSYNRYKAVVLRQPFYSSIPGFSLETHLRYCRQFEHNCLKAGVRHGVWTSPFAELHFGKSSDPGDFYGSGSAGWKMNAFKEFVRDVTAVAEGYSTVYFSLYDQLMVNGRLIGLGDLLKAPGSEQYTALVRYLRRRLGLPAPAAE